MSVKVLVRRYKDYSHDTGADGAEHFLTEKDPTSRHPHTLSTLVDDEPEAVREELTLYIHVNARHSHPILLAKDWSGLSTL